MAQPDIILDACIVDQVWVIVQDYLSRDIVQLLLSLLILTLLVIADCCQSSPVADNLGYARLFRVIRALGLFCQKLILILEACHFEESFAMVADYVITHFDILGQISVFDPDEAVTPNDMLLAVEEKLLPSLDLN